MFVFCSPGIVYVRDTTRGGLCSYPVFNNGISGAFCRTEAGQTAAIIFLFVTMVVYLIGAMVCLKLWRHEAARRYRERYSQEVRPPFPFVYRVVSRDPTRSSRNSFLYSNNVFHSEDLKKQALPTTCSQTQTAKEE